MKSLLSAFTIFLAPLVAVAEESPATKINFARDIQPILADTCFACHGPDEKTREAGLRLDERAATTNAVESGAIPIVPGKPTASELIRRINSHDASERMPPDDSKKRLTAEQKELLTTWIAQGAEYEELWSFIKPHRAELPPVSNEAWIRTPIDRFILHRLDAGEMSPAPEASRETLIRRLSLDLTGLPPTLSEIDAFLADESDRAYEKLVDRLLASPHYGERVAVEWLDAARFADTNGYHLDNGRDMTRWRSWVIDAFNENMPFDQFTIEQVAGDLLPNATLAQQLASGFNRNHMINFEGGAIPAEYHNAYIVDRVNTTATVWLGLTIACAQCHDHKYDPITQKEFYGLYAFFNNVPENGLDGNQGNAMPYVRVPDVEQSAALRELDAKIAELLASTEGDVTTVDEAQRAWEATLGKPADAQGTKAVELGTWHAVGPMIHPEGGLRAYNRDLGPEGKPVDLAAEYFLADKTYGWSERSDWIDGKIIELQGEQAATYVYRTITADQDRELQISLGSDDALKVWLNRKLLLSTETPRAAAPDQNMVTLELKKGRNELLMKVVNFFGGSGFYFALRSEAATATPENVLAIVMRSREQRTPQQAAELRNYYRHNVCQDSAWKKLVDTLAALRKERADYEQTIPTSMVMQEMSQPRDTFVLTRGQYDKPTDKVIASVPASLPPLPRDSAPDRLALARWLVSPEHPLTSRVIVNRYWQMLFGTGLVETSDDLGSRGELPSHPELLDWLAVEFQESSQADIAGTEASRWNVKALLKLIVLSAAYRQDSRVTPEHLERDPANRLLARGPRVRLQAEFIRDQALAVSGLLKHRIGGPSVSPYQPAGLWEELSSRGDSSKWTAQVFAQSNGDDLYRRSLYTFWKRTSPPPQMLALDAPDRETCTVRRARTNTPLQALILMNDPTYVESARKLAERTLGAGGPTDDQRLTFVFRLATARTPSESELSVMRTILREQTELYKDKLEQAKQLLSNGDQGWNTELDPCELAAWTIVSSMILNIDETVTKS